MTATKQLTEVLFCRRSVNPRMCTEPRVVDPTTASPPMHGWSTGCTATRTGRDSTTSCTPPIKVRTSLPNRDYIRHLAHLCLKSDFVKSAEPKSPKKN